jgi:hypothetical protein
VKKSRGIVTEADRWKGFNFLKNLVVDEDVDFGKAVVAVIGAEVVDTSLWELYVAHSGIQRVD